jgi:multidrug resistance efflux pump
MRSTNKLKVIFPVLLLLILAACRQSPDSAPGLISSTPTSRPIHTIQARLVAKSVLVPKRTAQLAFNISGLVQEVNVEIGDEVRSGDALIQLETTLPEAEVAHFEGVLQAAQAEFAYQKKLASAPELQNLAAAKIRTAEADLIKARYMLAQSTLKAPFDSTIVDLQILPNETVAAGKVVITLADMLSFQVETLDLVEIDLQRVYINQPVEVYIEALNTTMNGSVVTIAPQATQLGEERVFKIVIKLDSQPPGLRWGMSAESKFILDSDE